ncbi:MAG: hypothetical protein EPN97_14800 [Alphaproteobacteria bacterium]|nr:MAG: hypothetical protein EPN97_14800 [Alphaproteobacteria bacterium]
MSTTLNKQHQPKAAKGWLTKTALVVFAAVALMDLTGCAALKNSADTLGNAAGTQVTKAGLWVLGKDADCHFDAVNHSSYNPAGGSASGTETRNGCRELPSTAAQIKLAEQQEAIYNVHIREQQKRAQEMQRMQDKLRLDFQDRQAADTCHRHKLELLAQGKNMDKSDACTDILNKDRAQLSSAETPAKSKGFWSGWSLRD